MKKSIIITIIAFALIVYIVNAYPVVDFHQFYGDVTGVNDGENITATLGNSTFNTTITSHKYGYSPKFFVQGTNDGDTIKFYIKGVHVKTYSFAKGSLTELDLAYTGAGATTPTQPSTNYTPSTGGSGGSASTWYWRTTTPPYTLNQTNVTTPQGAPIECFDDWLCFEWGPCMEPGVQTRTCNLNDYPNCTAARPKPEETEHCELPPPPPANCFDGIQNQDETYTDCGGTICKQCDPYLTCVYDRDCITRYCNPSTRTCDWMQIEVPAPSPPPEPEPSYWWVWLIIGGLVIAAVITGITAYHYLGKETKTAPETASQMSDVRRYAQTFLKKGVSKEKIAAKLKEAGWKQEDIDEALK